MQNNFQHFCLNKDSTIIQKGDEADWMYILYKGSVEIIYGDREKGEYLTKDSGYYFGDTGLQRNERRNATIKALTPCETLILFKTDYDKVIREGKRMQKMNNLKFLKTLPYFQNWDPSELNKFNNQLETIVHKPGEVLFNQGEISQIFFIVKKGWLVMESILDIDLFYKCPSSYNKWTITKMTRRVKFKVKELKEGDFFGHDEIINEWTRNSRVYSLHESQVFYMNILTFK